jgi:hypothetical protein
MVKQRLPDIFIQERNTFFEKSSRCYIYRYWQICLIYNIIFENVFRKILFTISLNTDYHHINWL